MNGGNGKSKPAVESTGVPITTPWQPYPPALFLANHDSARGHITTIADDGRTRCTCCKAYLPRGGWSVACTSGLPRDFKGG